MLWMLIGTAYLNEFQHIWHRINLFSFCSFRLTKLLHWNRYSFIYMKNWPWNSAIIVHDRHWGGTTELFYSIFIAITSNRLGNFLFTYMLLFFFCIHSLHVIFLILVLILISSFHTCVLHIYIYASDIWIMYEMKPFIDIIWHRQTTANIAINIKSQFPH